MAGADFDKRVEGTVALDRGEGWGHPLLSLCPTLHSFILHYQYCRIIATTITVCDGNVVSMGAEGETLLQEDVENAYHSQRGLGGERGAPTEVEPALTST